MFPFSLVDRVFNLCVITDHRFSVDQFLSHFQICPRQFFKFSFASHTVGGANSVIYARDEDTSTTKR